MGRITKIVKVSTRKDNTSGYPGINWHIYKNKWQVRVYKDKKVLNIGYYKRKLDAIIAWKQARGVYGQYLCRETEQDTTRDV